MAQGNTMKLRIKAIVAFLLVIAVAYFGIWKLGFCHRYCNPGTSLLIQRNSGDSTPANTYANEGAQGVQEQMAVPGTYWGFDSIGYDLKEIPDDTLLAPEIAIVRNKVGAESSAYLVGKDEKGIRKDVLTPGTWKINPYGQEIVSKHKATYVPPGYVGVQIINMGTSHGVSNRILQPGFYFFNPQERQIVRMPIGFWEWTARTEFEDAEIEGKRVKVPKEGTGISVPTKDGKKAYFDASVIWGTIPENCAFDYEHFGNVQDIQKKIIEPQIVSACQKFGRQMSSMNFIQGFDRETFQKNVEEDVKETCAEKKVLVSLVLIRDFFPDPTIRASLQAAKIAEEEKKTLEKEMVRDTIAAQLEKAKRMVVTSMSDFDAETDALAAEEMEMGMKSAAETKATADQQVADLQKQTALIRADILKIQGQAEADVVEANAKAQATKLAFEIAASGGAEQYNRITLAESLMDTLNIKFIHTGNGTFWTSFGEAATSPEIKDLADKVLLQGSKTPVPATAPSK